LPYAVDEVIVNEVIQRCGKLMVCRRLVGCAGSVGIRIGHDLITAMSEQQDSNPGQGTVLERQEQRVKPPPMYQVMLLNDDYTPMEFVVVVLQQFFGKALEQATQIMLNVHRNGRGVCGIYPRDIAATKVEQVSEFARIHQHPLQCVMEEA